VGVKEAAQALREQTESKKRRRMPIVMPVGSWPGYLVTLIAFLSLAFAADVSPWRNDWEFVRVLFGDEPSQSVAGSWRIAKGEGVDTSGLPVDVDKSLQGTFNFADNGLVHIEFSDPSGKVGADGEYAVHGTTLYFRNLKNMRGASRMLPQNVVATLSWTGEDEMVLDITGHEVIDLNRGVRPTGR